MTTKNFVVKNGLSVGNVVIDANTGNLTGVGNANLGNLAVANFFSGNGYYLSGFNPANIPGVSTANYANFAGQVVDAIQSNITAVGTLANLSVSGNAVVGNLLTNNLLYANGQPWDLQEAAGSNNQIQYNINNNFAASANFTFDPATNILSVNGNISSGNLSTGALSATGTATVGNLSTGGTVSAGGTITGGNLATGGTLSVTGNANVGNIGANNAIFTTISATGNANVGNIGANNAVFTGSGSFSANINMNNQWINNVGYPNLSTDVATKSYVDTIASTGIAYHQPVLVATTTTLATATGGTTAYNSPNGAANGIGAYISTTGTFANIDGVSVTTVGTRILVKDEANTTWNGVYTYANSTAIVRSTDTDEYGPDSTEQLSINDYFFVQSGNVNEGVSYIVSAPAGTITFGTSGITFAEFSTSQVYNAGTGLTLTNTTFSVNNSQSQITSVGTLTSLSVSGNADAGNIGTGGLITATGNITGGNITTGGIVSASGNVTGANIITAGIVSATGNITGNYILGNGAFLTGIDATSIQNGTANVRTFNNANVTISAAGNANVVVVTGTGTIVDGTLSVTGNANIANIGTGIVTASGNITGANLVTGGVLSVTGNANIGNIGTAGLITATGNVTGGNISTGGVVTATGNITGGNLATAGTLSAGGNANVGNLGTTGVFASTLSSTGNANVGNIGTGGLITATGNITGANLVTGGVVSATGNVTGGNVITGGLVSATGNVNAGNLNATVGFGTSRSNVAVSTNTVIDEFNPSTFRTAKYVISASGDNGYQSVETLLVHDGVNSYITIYGSISSNNTADIIELSSNISGISGNVSVYATASGANTNVNLVASYIKT